MKYFFSNLHSKSNDYYINSLFLKGHLSYKVIMADPAFSYISYIISQLYTMYGLYSWLTSCNILKTIVWDAAYFKRITIYSLSLHLWLISPGMSLTICCYLLCQQEKQLFLIYNYFGDFLWPNRIVIPQYDTWPIHSG